MEILTQTLFCGMATGAAALTILLFLLQKGRLSALLRSNLLNSQMLNQLIDQMEWENELEPLIDIQLDALTVSFKQKHPMIGMFLTPAVADPLKEEGKLKLVEMMPAAEDKLIRYLSQDEVSENLEIHLKKWLKTKMFLFLSTAFGLGAIFGFFLGIILTLI